MAIIKSLFIFILAGFCEIGGGYLVWLCLKEDKPWWFGVCGGLVLALYGVVATLQSNNFGRVYATYGGILL
jgi:small multidrug resistance family-3 protein